MRKDKKNTISKQSAGQAPEADLPTETEHSPTAAEQPSKKYKYLIQNKKVRKVSRAKLVAMVLSAIILSTILLGGATYGVLSLVNYNNLKILIDRESSNIFSLSNDPDFSKPTEVLAIDGPRYMDNTSLLSIYNNLNDIEAANGSVSGEKYLAATFYLKNVTNQNRTLTEELALSNITQDLDSAIRIMLIRNGERAVYAKAKADGTPEEVVPTQNFNKDNNPSGEIWYTQPFQSTTTAWKKTGTVLAPGEVIKYSLIIWLEGWDEDCANDKIGGTIKVDFHINLQPN